MAQARGANGRFTGGGGGNLGDATGTIRLRYDPAGGAAARRDLGGIGNAAGDAGKKTETAGKVMAGAGAIIAGGFLLAIKAAAEFQAKLSGIQAVSGATAQQMSLISAKALQLGKDTVFSAGESADAIEELVKAGLDISSVLGGAADATVSLAAATGVDMATAATIASNALNQYKLSAADLPAVVDQLAGAANASAIDVRDLGESLSYVGPVAHATGLSIQDTATAIAILGNNGIKGSSAGTALRSMLSSLLSPTRLAVKQFAALGLLTADGTTLFEDQATGGIKPLNQVIGILNEKTKDLTLAQKNAFAKKAFGLDTLAAFSALAGETSDSVDAMTDSIIKVTAADVAATRMNNLKGSVEQLKGSVETVTIVLGTPFLNAVRKVVDALNVVIGLVLSAPAPIRTLVTAIGALSGVLLLLGGTLVLVGPKVRALRAELVLLSNGAVYSKIRSYLGLLINTLGGPWVAAFLAATAVVGALLLMNRNSKRSVEDLTEAIKADTGVLGENTKVAVANRLQKQGVLDVADKLGVNLADLTSAVLGEGAAQDKLTSQLDNATAGVQAQLDAVNLRVAASGGMDQAALSERDSLENQLDALNNLSGAYGANSKDMKTARGQYDQLNRAQQESTTTSTATTAATEQFNRALGRASESADKTTGTTNGLKTSVEEAGKAADGSAAEVTKLKNAIQQLLDTAFGAPRALDAFQSKLNALTKLAKENGHELSGTSDKAIANRAAFRDAADAIADYADAAKAQGKSPAEIAAKVQTLTDKLYASAGAAGYSKSQVKDLTKVLNELPGTINPQIILDAEAAEQKARNLKALLSSFHDITATVNIRAKTSNLRELEQQAGVPQMASGGVVTKPTLALVGEGRQHEAIMPLDVLDAAYKRIYAAGKTSVYATQSTGGGSAGSGSGSGSGKGQRLVSGSLSIDRSGRAWIKGVAEDVTDGNDQFARAHARMGG